MDCSMKRIFSNIFGSVCLLAAVLLTPSCQKKFKMELPLATDRNELYVPSEAGTKYIVVWSTADWTADFETPVDWATLERASSGSINGLYVHYTENQEISRGVNIVITAGSQVRKVYFAQKAGMSSPLFAFDMPSISLLMGAKTISVPYQTNLSATDVLKAKCSVKYAEGSGEGWIKEFCLEGMNGRIAVDDNASGADRQAILSVEIPGAFVGEGASSQIILTQSKENANIKIDGGDITVDGLSVDIVLPYTINFDASIYPEYKMTYGFKDASGNAVDWIKNVELTAASLKGRTKVNKNASRSATAFIQLTGGSAPVSATAKVTQATTDAEITDGDSDQEQIKDPEEEF